MKTSFGSVLMLLLLAGAIPAIGHAESRAWEHVGPVQGGSVLPDRMHADRWYSFVDYALYRSDNGARSWHKIPTPILYRFQIHPVDSTLYMIGPGGANTGTLYVSRDEGRTFVAAGTTMQYMFRPDPLNSNTLYSWDSANGNNSVLKSTDLGGHWSQIPFSFTPANTFGCSSSMYLADILPSPFQPGTLYASLEPQFCPVRNHRLVRLGLLATSNDGGATWHQEFSSRTGSFTFLYDSARPDRAYAYSQSGGTKLAALTMQGWQSLQAPPCPPSYECDVQALAVTPRLSNGLVIVRKLLSQHLSQQFEPQYQRCFTSDGGANWTIAESPFYESLSSFFISNSDPAYQLVAAEGGVYRKDTEWVPSNRGFESRIQFMSVTAGANTVYAFHDDWYGHLLYRSRDAGKTWKDLRFKLPKGWIATMGMDPANPEHLILEMARGVLYSFRPHLQWANYYTSEDGGESWRFLFRVDTAGDYGDLIAFDPLHPSNVYFSAASHIYKSTEGGAHPQRGLKVGGLTQIYVDPTRDGTVFFINGDLLQSNDGGKTVYFSGTGLPYVDEGEPAGYMAGVGAGGYLVENDDAVISRSLNGGTRWQPISHLNAGRSGGGDPPGAGPFYAADPQRTHFFGISHGYLFESINAGLSWKRINSEIPHTSYFGVMALSDPSLGPLYIAADNGIWKAGSRPAASNSFP